MSTNRSESLGPAAERKLFTIDGANAALPLVRAIVQDVVALSHEMVDRRERLISLRSGRTSERQDVYSEELAHVEEELERSRARLYEYADELRALGVELKDGLIGLVDFPSLHEDRVVYLCWKLDEPEVAYWHELDSGFSGRRSLADFAAADHN
ncbi:MAG: DUF2203 domain-containing protein [Planctomycetia bacterium]|nr:DUF2203 domain-containing protein [Planctomycetia bacterium]